MPQTPTRRSRHPHPARGIASLPIASLAVVIGLGSLGTHTSAQAQAPAWPVKGIRLIVPFPPAGGTDIVARTMAPHLSAALGQTVTIDNKPGAGGTIGTDIVAKASPDGYTLLMATSSTHAVAPNLNPKLPYDPVRDFAPVMNVNIGPNILVVTAGLPVHSVRELIALGRSRPGKLTFASSGTGTVYHLSGEMFKSMANLEIVHVPYKGSGLAFSDLISGEVSMMFDATTSVMPHVKSGKLRALAITSTRRNPTLPEIPTMIEAGVPGYESTLWIGLFAPAGTARAIVTRINAEANQVVRRPDVREAFAQQGTESVGGSPEAFAAQIQADIVRWGKVIRDAGVQME